MKNASNLQTSNTIHVFFSTAVIKDFPSVFLKSAAEPAARDVAYCPEGSSPFDNQWSQADVKDVLCKVKVALKQCRDLADLRQFRKQISAIVQQKLLARADRKDGGAKTTACTKSPTACRPTACPKSTASTQSTACTTCAPVGELTPKLHEILDSIEAALRECYDAAVLYSFLSLVRAAVHDELLRRSTTRRCKLNGPWPTIAYSVVTYKFIIYVGTCRKQLWDIWRNIRRKSCV